MARDKYDWWLGLRSGGIAKSTVPAVQETTVTMKHQQTHVMTPATTAPELTAVSANITSSPRSDQDSTSPSGQGESSAGKQ